MRIIIHFNKSSKIREFNKAQVTTFIAGLIILVVGLIATILSLLIHNSSSSIINENRKLKNTITELTAKLNEIQGTLVKINETERKLLLASGVNLDFEYGIGGSENNDLKNLINGNLNNLGTLKFETDQLLQKIKFQQEKFEKLVQAFSEKEDLAKRIPGIVPMDGVFSDHGFGMRIHPILKRWKMHEGLDINGLYGTPVYATGAGVVKFVGWNGGLGLCVVIDHGYGYETTYGHLSKANVREGQKVVRFQKIGECGSTGLSTGPHLHYEVSFNGEKQNPVYYFLK
ncbi:MAG: M23 family metallopeptidase [Ignavibacteria bacterium]|jgi:murein DD-endopeptidase MepM/ murein hydrolase activator NlpD|nr:M23 family metallopeptidase [Ignavibacteria bacterium]MDH7528174.1 M23 family metallopeptidase [Ignavibacteria bacterium]